MSRSAGARFTRRWRLGLLAVVTGLLACEAADPVDIVFVDVDVKDVEFAPELGVDLEQMTEHSSGLYFQDIVEGDGVEAESFYLLEVEYQLWLADGTLIEDIRGREPPFAFQIGTNLVIPGWDIGMLGAKPGGVRRLVIPPQLAYGPLGQGPILPLATLVFEVKVLSVQVI